MIEILYHVTCAGCSSEATGAQDVLVGAGWRTITPTPGRLGTVFDYPLGGLDALCKDCVAALQPKIDALDKAQADLTDAVGKFDGTLGAGTVDNPIVWKEGMSCVLNAYYSHDGKLYVYMPSDAEAKSYATWDEAAADMAEWEEA